MGMKPLTALEQLVTRDDGPDGLMCDACHMWLLYDEAQDGTECYNCEEGVLCGVIVIEATVAFKALAESRMLS